MGPSQPRPCGCLAAFCSAPWDQIVVQAPFPSHAHRSVFRVFVQIRNSQSGAGFLFLLREHRTRMGVGGWRPVVVVTCQWLGQSMGTGTRGPLHVAMPELHRCGPAMPAPGWSGPRHSLAGAWECPGLDTLPHARVSEMASPPSEFPGHQHQRQSRSPTDPGWLSRSRPRESNPQRRNKVPPVTP